MQTDGFIIGYMMCRFINLLLYSTAMYSCPSVIPQFVYGFTVQVVLFIFSFALTGFRDGRQTFLLISNVMEFILLVPMKPIAHHFVVTKIYRYPDDVNIRLIPMNLSVAQRRLMMWIMMVCIFQ